jgi:HK97 family phage portal protein
MSFITDLFQRLQGQPNPLDTYLLRLIGTNTSYPSPDNDTFLASYLDNNDVFTVINKIVEPASTVPIYQYDKNGEEVPGGKMIALLNNPNPYQGRAELIEAAMSYYYIFGESFTASQSVPNGLNANKPLRLDQLPPKYVGLKLGTFFNPVEGYFFYPIHKDGEGYTKDQVMHWKEFNPEYDQTGGHLRGMSRLRPLIKSVTGSSDGYDALVKSFKNMGAWGLLTMMGEANMPNELSKLQQSELKAKFKRDQKKGDLSVVNNLTSFTKMGLTVVELEILKALGIYKGNLCDAFNVPSQLLSGSQDRTYNNYTEAERALWRNAIQPSLNAYLEKLTAWLAPQFGEDGHTLQADYSGIDCLQGNKLDLVQWMTLARSFTKNEIREALGYEMLPDPAMDQIYEGAGLMPLADLQGNITEPAMKALGLSDYRK